jgi:prophage regulatory protein
MRKHETLSLTALLDTLRVDDVLIMCKVSRTTLYQWITAGRFPEPIRLGVGKMSRVVWHRAEIEEWLQHQPQGGWRYRLPKRVEV